MNLCTQTYTHIQQILREHRQKTFTSRRGSWLLKGGGLNESVNKRKFDPKILKYC